MSTTTQQPSATPKVTIKDRLQQAKQFAADRANQISASLKGAWLTVFPVRDEVEEEREGGFFQAFLQVVLWLAFAAFLLASLPHVAYFFATFEPQNSDGSISDYWWFVAYALAVAIDVTAFLLSLNVAVKMRRATAGLPWIQKIIPGLIVIVTHWPFIVALVGFSWLVNFEHAKEFHSSMLAAAETVTVNLVFWQGTLGDLNPVIASAFPVLAVAYTGMSDQIGDQRKTAKRQRQAVMTQAVHAAQQAAMTPPAPTTVTPDWQAILLTMQEMNAKSLQSMQAMNQQNMQVTIEQFTRVTIEAVREVVEQVALPAPNSPAQIEAPKTAQIEAQVSAVVAQTVDQALRTADLPAQIETGVAQALLATQIGARIDRAVAQAMRDNAQAAQTSKTADAHAHASTQTPAHTTQTLAPDAHADAQLSALSDAESKRLRILQFIDAQRAQGRIPEAREIVEASGCALRTAQAYRKSAMEA